MAFGSFNPARQQSMLSDINVTPMVDVMLVLLVIFIITAPMFTYAVKLELPHAQASAAQQQADTVTISVDAAGVIFWNDARVDDAALAVHLATAAAQAPQPELQLRADKATRYDVVAKIMAAAQSTGLTRFGFVLDPKKEAEHGQH